ncbi:TPA: TetR/AcrR family transcriptional regulator [Vibrio vulnificus]|uniref:TetR/AcrR family transcriptional regulator n=1 Tax=Vibrio vulnificus TaxID=672 RepID=UPI0019D4598F|nr:TetR/AcrR family transcriptional regulator [Vibrio vulnificus]MBN8145702.1 TetR/AcrR family transcriptional regulator [Vibrio vulnificus]MCA0768919.1 TetR/AcrR family transcriptional regulator [Vibrio vulnificus]HAS6061736.1 TetR family transcriptional regulator [Vibrio vulnificus]HAS6159706.1 TetR family transcriptional regulator [Vibrio vulnificus]HAS6191459.1 TetR family transcriptional regulator [Vibrio vulnificus]
MNTKTNDTRQHILDVGYQLVVNQGFTAVGLSQLLKEAGVPKGSFYHYFKSKEQFGQALIEEYFHQYLARLEAHFNQQNDSGFDNLISYFSRWLSFENGVCNANRCLVVKLSAEVSDLSEAMRHTLSQGAQRVILALASAVQTGIDDGSISVNNATATAQQLYQQWLGASLLNKLMQDQTHLEQCLASTKQILKG